MNAISDAELIVRVILHDDRHAFAHLVRRYQSEVRGLLRRLCRSDQALADDLAQETFIRAYRALRSFRSEAKFSTWLYRIAYNIFVSDARSQRTRDHVSLEELPAIEDEVAGGVAVDLQQDLQTALALLTEKERLAIHICYQQGLSHSEAADVLGQPLGTIKTDINRGKQKLREYLAAWKESVVL